jgi:hypothetical protein
MFPLEDVVLPDPLEVGGVSQKPLHPARSTGASNASFIQCFDPISDL